MTNLIETLSAAARDHVAAVLSATRPQTAACMACGRAVNAERAQVWGPASVLFGPLHRRLRHRMAGVRHSPCRLRDQDRPPEANGSPNDQGQTQAPEAHPTAAHCCLMDLSALPRKLSSLKII